MRKKEKQLMRRAVKRETAELPESYCREADQKIFDHIRELPEYQKARTVFCYVGTSGEIDTVPILKHILESGKILGVPKCIRKGIMEVFHVEDLKNLRLGSFGIQEPEENCRRMDSREIDLALIPCLCCSRTGQRLGYGGGYYDRYLRNSAFTMAVLCREKLIKEQIPVEDHDIVMDLVISEEGVFRKNNVL